MDDVYEFETMTRKKLIEALHRAGAVMESLHMELNMLQNDGTITDEAHAHIDKAMDLVMDSLKMNRLNVKPQDMCVYYTDTLTDGEKGHFCRQNEIYVHLCPFKGVGPRESDDPEPLECQYPDFHIDLSKKE